jgi:SAM-dependent methyltransferase
MRFKPLDKLVRRMAEYFWYYGASDSWRAIFSLLERNDGASLLDLGCGDGSSTMLVAERIGASKVYGIDLDEENVMRARERGVLAYSSDLNEKFPFEDESIDVVFANQVIEHLIDVDNFVSEIYRVLKRGGYAIICTENLASWHNIFALLLGNQPYSGPQVSVKHVIGHHPLHPQMDSGKAGNPYLKHNTVMAFKALKEIFRVYGFKIEKVIGSGYYPFPKLLGRVLCRLDKAHAHFLTLKVRK